jgi:hypothetical protein
MKSFSLHASLFLFLALCSAPALAQEKELTNSVLPFYADVWVPCANNSAGEWVSLAGGLHAVISAQLRPNDTVILRTHVNPQNVFGLAWDSGTWYRANGVTWFSLTLDSSPVPLQDYRYVNNFHLVGSGPGNNLFVKHDIHIRLLPGGTFAVNWENLRITCQ